jgi:hypothetical protein
MRVELDVSAGELVDRITILELKAQKLPDAYRSHVARELTQACRVRDRVLDASQPLTELTQALRAVNLELWEIEEEVRQCEHCRNFGSRFVQLARQTYLSNDRRSALKQRISVLFGDGSYEFKSYALPQV